MSILDNASLIPQFTDQGVSCYKLEGPDYLNEYYVVSEAETRKLLNKPEVISYDVYRSMLNATGQMMYYFKQQNKVTSANILCILRGALNFPLEESCYQEHIRVHDISFLSCERVMKEAEVVGLSVKYEKLALVAGSTLLIGDIIASGDTLALCMKYVMEFYQKHGKKLRNIIIFTIGGARAISHTEKLTKEIREVWPDFEGFITVFYEGVFGLYDHKGVSGINWPMIDFYWENGIIAPEFRQQTLSMQDPLFEKCIIYDGGARRYEIQNHVEEVLEFWEYMAENGDKLSMEELLTEKLGHALDISYDDWVKVNHYEQIEDSMKSWLYRQEQGFISGVRNESIKEIAERRVKEFKTAMQKYIIE